MPLGNVVEMVVFVVGNRWKSAKLRARESQSGNVARECMGRYGTLYAASPEYDIMTSPSGYVVPVASLSL